MSNSITVPMPDQLETWFATRPHIQAALTPAEAEYLTTLGPAEAVQALTPLEVWLQGAAFMESMDAAYFAQARKEKLLSEYPSALVSYYRKRLAGELPEGALPPERPSVIPVPKRKPGRPPGTGKAQVPAVPAAPVAALYPPTVVTLVWQAAGGCLSCTAVSGGEPQERGKPGRPRLTSYVSTTHPISLSGSCPAALQALHGHLAALLGAVAGAWLYKLEGDTWRLVQPVQGAYAAVGTGLQYPTETEGYCLHGA